MASLFTVFAVVAMLVAALGVYSIVSHSVSTRTREFGVRIALGATLRDVRQSVFREGNVLALLGIAAVASFLFAVTLLASWVPARRAMRIDPVEALRND